MSISERDVVAALSTVLERDVSIDPGTPLLETDLDIDSLKLVTLFGELERLVGVGLPQEDAFEMLGLTVTQIANKLDQLQAQRRASA